MVLGNGWSLGRIGWTVVVGCGEMSLGQKRPRSKKWRKKAWMEDVDVELRVGTLDEAAREAFW